MEVENSLVTAPHILKLIAEGQVKALEIEKNSISADILKQMKKSGWRIIRVDLVGDKMKCYFIRE